MVTLTPFFCTEHFKIKQVGGAAEPETEPETELKLGEDPPLVG